MQELLAEIAVRRAALLEAEVALLQAAGWRRSESGWRHREWGYSYTVTQEMAVRETEIRTRSTVRTAAKPV